MLVSRFLWAVLCFALILLTLLLACTLRESEKNPAGYVPNKDLSTPTRDHFNISKAWIISMYHTSHHTTDLAKGLLDFLHIPEVHIFPAINGTHALQTDAIQHVSLYTRYLMLSGRHDHMQLSSPGMLGCLLSHAHIWKTIQPNETVAIFEEDAYVDMISAQRMHVLYQDIKSHNVRWDVLLLESGHNLIASGKWINIGNQTATCLYQKSSEGICTWFGTRGYLITHRGAQHLLRHVYPISVQVDSLMGLVASFSPGFKMFWTRKDIAHLRLFHITGVWDACFKCYLPSSPYPYVLVITAMLLACCRNIRKFSLTSYRAWTLSPSLN